MRKPILIILFFLSVVSLFFPSCNKNDGNYLDKYFGSWEFLTIFFTMNLTTNEESTDTVTFTGVIYAGTEDAEVIVQYSEESYIKLHIGTDGTVLDQCMPPSSCHGEFSGDTSFYYRHSSRVGISGAQVVYVKSIHGVRVSSISSLNTKPIADTYLATGVALNGARLKGGVSAGYLSTNVFFDYGTSTKYGSTVVAAPASIAGSVKTNVDCYISKLAPGTVYHYRVRAVNSMGTSLGADQSFTTKNPESDIVDIEGNNYKTVRIDDQVWMAENLRTQKFRNGEAIPTTSIVPGTVLNEAEPVYQWVYDGIETWSGSYGRLYTWYAVADKRNLCPEGWHIHSIDEADTLIHRIGEYNGGSLKETGTVHWKSPNEGATNATGFSGLPGGHAYMGNMMIGFYRMSESGYWWTSSLKTATSEHAGSALAFYLDYDSNHVGAFYFEKRNGASIRCVRD